jgi:hypothetical protein
LVIKAEVGYPMSPEAFGKLTEKPQESAISFRNGYAATIGKLPEQFSEVVIPQGGIVPSIGTFTLVYDFGDRRLSVSGRRLSDFDGSLSITYDVAVPPDEAATMKSSMAAVDPVALQANTLEALVANGMDDVAVEVPVPGEVSDPVAPPEPPAATPPPTAAAVAAATPAPSPTATPAEAPAPLISSATAFYVFVGMCLFFIVVAALYFGTKGIVGTTKKPEPAVTPALSRQISQSMHQGVGPFKEPTTMPAPVGGKSTESAGVVDPTMVDVSLDPSAGPTGGETSRSENDQRLDLQSVGVTAIHTIHASDIEATAVAPAPADAPWYQKFFCNCGPGPAEAEVVTPRP